MAASCWSSLASMMAVPVPHLVRKPWRQSWNSMAALILVSRTCKINFHTISSKPIPQNCPSSALGSKIRIPQAISCGIAPVSQICVTARLSVIHSSGIGLSSRFVSSASRNHSFKGWWGDVDPLCVAQFLVIVIVITVARQGKNMVRATVSTPSVHN